MRLWRQVVMLWMTVGACALEAVPPTRSADRIVSHVSSSSASRVSAHAIISGGEIAVIDAPPLREDAAAFIARLRRQGARVTLLFITHPDPEHSLGLKWLHEAFPQAAVVAMPKVAEALRGDGQREMPEIADHDRFQLKVGRSEWEILPFTNAESRVAYALWNPRSKQLVAGDLVQAGTHLSLGDPEGGPQQWARALEQLAALYPRQVFPGHGPAGGPELIARNRDYLRYFLLTLSRARSARELEDAMRARFPRLGLPGNLVRAAHRYGPAVPETLPAPGSDGGARRTEAPVEPGTRKAPPPDLTR